jgi:hypothetical protein
MRIAPAAFAAVSDYYRLVAAYVGDNTPAAAVADDSPLRHFYSNIFGVFPRAIAAAAVFTVLRKIFPFITKILKRREISVGDKDNIAALPAVTAVRTTGVNIFLTVKTHRTDSAAARFYGNAGFIYKY